jgi:hypothetical protein
VPRTPSLRRIVAVILLLVAVAALLGACSSSGTSTSTQAIGTTGSTNGSATTTAPAPDGTTVDGTNTTQPPVVANPAGNAIAREIKATSQAIATLNKELFAANVADNDPRLGPLYGLRARAQAFIAQRALLDGQPALADAAALQMIKLLGQGVAVAREPTLSVLKQAQHDLAGLGVPSSTPNAAVPKLIAAAATLAPLLPPPTSTTTTAGGSPPTT